MMIFKKAGIFGQLKYRAQEFTVRDLYQLAIYDKDTNRPQVCREADPHLEYCQIMGKTRVKLPGYSTINPYPHMNEKCESLAPKFERTDRC
jgi:hypothetical protein